MHILHVYLFYVSNLLQYSIQFLTFRSNSIMLYFFYAMNEINKNYVIEFLREETVSIYHES